MSSDDGYGRIARHYDSHGWDWYATERGPRLADLLAERGLAEARVLDAGCGTGSLAFLLAERGHRVTGMDLSRAMIDVARSKDKDGRIDWRVGDVTAFETKGEPFDVAVCVADTLNHLESLDAWERAFRCFHATLRPGGTLFFDAVTERGLRRMDRFEVAEEGGRTLILGVIFEPATRRSTLKATSFVPHGDAGLYEKATQTITEWAQPVADVLARLERAGFADATRVWARSGDAERADRMSVVATRR